MTQQTGQGKRVFAKAVKMAANEVDIAALTLQDSLCLVILTGCKDARLREKMSELDEPTMTIAAFNTIIDAHMHSKATANAASSARANSQPNRGRGNNRRNSQSGLAAQQNRQPLSDAEKKR